MSTPENMIVLCAINNSHQEPTEHLVDGLTKIVSCLKIKIKLRTSFFRRHDCKRFPKRKFVYQKIVCNVN